MEIECPNYKQLDNYCGLQSGCIQGQVLDPKTGYQNAMIRRVDGKSYTIVNPRNMNEKMNRRSFSKQTSVTPYQTAHDRREYLYGCGRCGRVCGCNCKSGAPCECGTLMNIP